MVYKSVDHGKLWSICEINYNIYTKAKGAIELLGGLGGMLPQKILQS